MKTGISGLDEVIKNINRELKKVELNGVEGLIESGIAIRREGQTQTPVDTGNLINSWYGPTPFETPKGPVVEIGLTASYAEAVHEKVDAHFQKPGSKAKFLEDPIKHFASVLLLIFAKKMVIK